MSGYQAEEKETRRRMYTHTFVRTHIQARAVELTVLLLGDSFSFFVTFSSCGGLFQASSEADFNETKEKQKKKKKKKRALNKTDPNTELTNWCLSEAAKHGECHTFSFSDGLYISACEHFDTIFPV